MHASDLINLAAVGCNILIALFTRSAARAAQMSAEPASQTAADSHKQSEPVGASLLSTIA